DHYTYDIHPVEKDKLDSFMKEKAFKAINVTIPYKKDVIPYLTELDDASKKIGAVNTIVNKNGNLYGYNTDYYGFDYMVRKHKVSFTDKKVLVLGNGGASQAIQAVIKDHGAKEMLVTDIVMNPGILSIEEVYDKHPDIDIVVNTTPCGMYPNVDSAAVDLSQFKKIEAVFDCVYNPMDTEFTLQAKELGIKVAVTGLEMLVAQAKRALEHFKDIQIDDEEIDRIYREILLETANLITTCQDINVLNELSSKIQKPVVYFQQDEQQAIENNQILVIDKNDIIKHHKRLISNGFIVDGDSTSLILEHFKKSIQNY
uniref:shikimate dehydrogenase family protein n=1 Tax=uncultured Faecalicoccus sp. TaxID=1971760 RepID=UPI002625EF9F